MGKKKSKTKALKAVGDEEEGEAEEVREEKEIESTTATDTNSDQEEGSGEEEGAKKKVESKGQMKKRHMKEQKELKLKISQMQHKVPKSDKAARDALAKEIKTMSDALAARHEQELRDLDARASAAEEAKAAEAAAQEEERAGALNAQKQVRMQQKMERQAELERAEKERMEKLLAEAGPSAQAVERDAVAAKLRAKGLVLRDVPADGNCLFHALADQLGEGKSHSDVRSEVVAYIREHPSEYAGFMDEGGGSNNEGKNKKKKGKAKGGNGESEREKVDAYCERMARNGCWGGDIEINAAAKLYGCTVTVVSANADNVVIGSGGRKLVIAYLKHDLSTGEHYNSVAKA